MIQTDGRPSTGNRNPRRTRRKQEPLEVRVSLDFVFGDKPDERVTMLDDRKVPFVGTVYDNRDRIMRNFVLLLLRAGATQPKVISELVPAVKLLKKLRRPGF